MKDDQWKWLMNSIVLISQQLNHLKHQLDHLSVHLGAELPGPLIQAGKDLARKTDALRVVLEAQAPQPQPKGP